MPPPPDDLAALMERLMRGDEAALAELLRRFEPAIRRAARRRLGPALRAQVDSLDIAQSIHRTLLLSLRRQGLELSTPDQVLALAVTLVRRKVARHCRRLRGRIGAPGLGVRLATPRPAADDPAAAAEEEDAARAVLRHLDDDLDRELVRLRLQGHSTADVARLLGVDAGLLRVRLGRLRQRLRERNVPFGWI